MNLPKGQPDFLAQIHQQLGPPPPRPAEQPPLIDNGAIAQGGFSVMPPGPVLPPPAPLPPPPSVAPPPPPMNAAPPPPPAPFLQRVAGGIVNRPEREVEMRGPQLKQAQTTANAAMEGAVKAVAERSQETAAADYAIALEQERKATIRQDAANYSAAERANEMAERQADFDMSVKALSKQSVDPDRFYANASTGTKIGALLQIAMGGFLQGRAAYKGQNISNPGMEQLQHEIDRDIKAQEFSYNAARDTVNAKQTAFSMAMQKYNNVDAARAAARAAALDAAQAQLGKQAAMWKGTEAANRAQMMSVSLKEGYAAQVAAGVSFTPASAVAVGGGFVDPRTGITYSNKEAQGVVKDIDTREHADASQARGIAGQLMVEGSKAGAKGHEELDKGTRFIAEKLQTAGVPQARAAAEEALAALNKSPGGIGEATARGALGGGTIANKVLGEDAAAREQSYNNFKNAAMKALFGNVTAAEQDRAEKQFGAANDPESRRRAIKSALGMLENVEKGIKAGENPAVQAEYDKRRQNADGAPPVAPKGAKAGW